MINKLLLLILDGFGWNEEEYGNAIAAAHTPCIDDFFHKHPPVLLQTCGNFVGLPSGAMGNSEVGHLNIGAGRIVYQLNTLIDKAIVDGSFFNNPCLQDSLEHALKNNGNVHLFGLISDGNVHSHIDHLQALLEYFRLHDFRRIYIHAFLDGRDTLPNSGLGFMKTLLDICQRKGIGQVATVSGRYYAMDRDNRWERIKKAYDAIVHGKGEYYNDALSAIRSSYEAGITDEFVVPRVIG
ncbi:MAG: 2,3-bisphosphoglycerate-independent phosphoglycerate mutase, partial [Candidatus Cloacimonetes bacterium]|nr:2,3-bisphosphoglycerate-independent phosphoglycerate mutase [Candidatus Cloacimonadota bacterium]